MCVTVCRRGRENSKTYLWPMSWKKRKKISYTKKHTFCLFFFAVSSLVSWVVGGIAPAWNGNDILFSYKPEYFKLLIQMMNMLPICPDMGVGMFWSAFMLISVPKKNRCKLYVWIVQALHVNELLCKGKLNTRTERGNEPPHWQVIYRVPIGAAKW